MLIIIRGGKRDAFHAWWKLSLDPFPAHSTHHRSLAWLSIVTTLAVKGGEKSAQGGATIRWDTIRRRSDDVYLSPERYFPLTHDVGGVEDESHRPTLDIALDIHDDATLHNLEM